MYYGTDFRPLHLKVIYDMYKNNIVNEYLSGNIECYKPELIQFSEEIKSGL